MSLGEFSLIQHFFNNRLLSSSDNPVVLGIGDDAAVVDIPQGRQMVQTIDTLIAGKHFPLKTPARDVAYKALAVNVSDLVAMAADPAWFVLSLTLPNSDESFLQDFADGLFEAADSFSIRLIGGDTCQGDLSITIQASGLVPSNRFITRSGARVGDRIFVSGELGAAAAGLANLQGDIQLTTDQQAESLRALNRPQPQLRLISILRQYASSAIDISDGLVGDLGHIVQLSQVGARLDKKLLPVFPWIALHDRYDLALYGGDDYQVVFTVSESDIELMLSQAKEANLPVNEIGLITDDRYVLQDGGQSIDLSTRGGFDHFEQ